MKTVLTKKKKKRKEKKHKENKAGTYFPMPVAMFLRDTRIYSNISLFRLRNDHFSNLCQIYYKTIVLKDISASPMCVRGNLRLKIRYWEV
jgi:hypothetical protein